MDCGHPQLIGGVALCSRGRTISSSLWVISERVWDHIWLHWSESLHEFLEANFRITIQVEAAHDRNQLALQSLVAEFGQEASDCCFVDVPEICGVDSLERTPDAELLEFLKVLLQLFEFELEVDFLGEEDCQLTFNKRVQVLVAQRAARGPLRAGSSQIGVSTWKHDRHETE